ncbi:MAG: hypothetical protein ACLSVD_08840 [Eggerthellaceae bacterium]
MTYLKDEAGADIIDLLLPSAEGGAGHGESTAIARWPWLQNRSNIEA